MKEKLKVLLREAELAHHEAEQAAGSPDGDWPEFYASYLASRLDAGNLGVQVHPAFRAPHGAFGDDHGVFGDEDGATGPAVRP